MIGEHREMDRERKRAEAYKDRGLFDSGNMHYAAMRREYSQQTCRKPQTRSKCPDASARDMLPTLADS